MGHGGDGGRGWRQWVLVCRGIANPEAQSSYQVFDLPGSPVKRARRVVGTRWRIETGFERAKAGAEMDQYAVRR